MGPGPPEPYPFSTRIAPCGDIERNFMDGFSLMSGFSALINSRRLSLGYLEAPKESGGDWEISVQLTSEMWVLASTRSTEIQMQLRSLLSDDKPGFAIWVQEIGTWQHRTIIPLLGKTCAEFLKSLEKNPLQLRLTDAGTLRSMSMKRNIPIEAVRELQQSHSLHWTKEQYQSAAMLVMLASKPRFLEPIDCEKVNNVCLTFLMPPEMDAYARVMMSYT